MLRVGVPEEIRVVVEMRVAIDAHDDPIPDGKRVMLAAGGARVLRNYMAGAVESSHSGVRLRHQHPCRLSLQRSGYVRNQDLLARPAKRGAWIQGAQDGRVHLKRFAEFL